ncbi:Aldehyde dehydrogenase [Clostridiaceae bacterium JG1575]|nr:Aldehyde dehydrogenase [Clostridiaceae bacterium JG1575]
MSIEEQVQRARERAQSGMPKRHMVRRNALLRLKKNLRLEQKALEEALYEDLGKSAMEASLTELAMVYLEIDHALRRGAAWAAPKSMGRSLLLGGSSQWLLKEPYGLVLILVPFNYPVGLALAPLVSAVASGNAAVVKTSSLTPHVSQVLARLIEASFAPGHVTLIAGGEGVNDALLAQRFDKILFTGSALTAKKIMAKASETLTPVILELGGKSPAIVLKDADLTRAAKKIVWGKFTNAGQTCIAPDHVLVHETRREALVEAMIKAIQEFYGKDPHISKDFGRIISREATDRLMGYLDEATPILYGGGAVRSEKYMEPTLVGEVPSDHPLRHEEIFGPILPIWTYKDINQCIAQQNQREKPLALYVFSKNMELAQKVMERIPAGGGCLNDCLVHAGAKDLPFGGVGYSGMGRYHGAFGFQAFTHEKGVVRSSPHRVLSVMLPPYSKWKEVVLKRLLP